MGFTLNPLITDQINIPTCYSMQTDEERGMDKLQLIFYYIFITFFSTVGSKFVFFYSKVPSFTEMDQHTLLAFGK